MALVLSKRHASVTAQQAVTEIGTLDGLLSAPPALLAVVEVLSGLVVKFPRLVELSGSGDSSTIRSLV